MTVHAMYSMVFLEYHFKTSLINKLQQRQI